MSLIGDSIEQELAVARCMCSCRGDDDALNKADAELFQLRKIAESAELACGLLWMIDLREGRTLAAYHALRDAIGGSGSDGLGRGIQRAIDAGYEADHPSGCTWWAGKKDATQ